MSKEVTAKSYQIRDEKGNWLGQIVLTSDGFFSSVTDYGNFSFAWRSFGDGDFRDFIVGLNIPYFGGKMYQGIAYVSYGKKFEKSAMLFAEKILPALQKAIMEELEIERSAVMK